MAIPATTYILSESMDPSDLLDYQIDLSGLLEAGETVASYSLFIPAESVLLGLTLGTSAYATTRTGNIITFWASIDSAQQGNVIFNTGATLPIEVNITTSSTPPRKKQRTIALKVVQK